MNSSMLTAAWALAKKDLRSMWRDRTAMVLTILVPIALVSVFGWIMAYAFGGGSGGMPKVSLHVANFSQTQRSREFVSALAATDMVRVRNVEFAEETQEDPEKAEGKLTKLISDGDAHHVLVIPADFDEQVDAGETPGFRMLRDPGRQMEDQLIQISLMQAAVSELGGTVFTEAMERILEDQGMDAATLSIVRSSMTDIDESISGFFEDQPVDNPPSDEEEDGEDASSNLVEAETKTSQEEPQSSFSMDGMMEFMQEVVPINTTDVSPPNRNQQVTFQQAQSVAGMTVMMLLFALTSCGSVLIVEREEGTLKRLFAQPVNRNSILLGKFMFVFLVGIVQIAVLFGYGELMFRVGLFRDPVTLIVLSLTWVATGGAFGMFLASVCKSTKQSESLASLLILMMAALGGCWFPLQLMSLPPLLEFVCKSTMTFWAMTGFQGMLWNQLPWYADKTLLALGWQWGWTLLFIILSVTFFRRNYCRG